MKRSFWFLLIGVFALGIFLRLWRLNEVPPSPSLDEVSIGYNAYSILTTGADEYGYKFPVLLRAYDDWRPALYVYTVIPFVWLLGLSAVAVRLPAVILSIITLVGAYFLAKELFRSQKLKKPIALCATFLLAISPWHVYISRLGHEVNLGLTLLVWATFIFLRKNLFVSGALFALSLYAYQSEKIITPVIILVLAFLYKKELFKQKKKVFLASLTSTLLVIPLVWATIGSPGLIRFAATNVFAEAHPLALVTTQYISHFKPQWLFSGSEREAHKIPNLGLLYIWEAPLILLGLFFLWRWPVASRIRWVILLWLLAAPIPAAITTQAPHAMRSYTFLPMLQILGGLGLVGIISRGQRFVALAILFLAVGSLQVFNKQYFDIFPKTQSDSFQYALGQAIPTMISLSKDYDHVIVSNQKNLYQSYMFYLFYSRFDPRMYQQLGGTVSGGYAETHTIGKFFFRPIDWTKDSKAERTLLVGNPSEFSQRARTLAEFANLDGHVGVRMVSLQ
ncbi:glycosyltransferase family 39 protein [Candidatus Gottesmanbacteria bacterium]|nr:glycosyltransferase family 39 protein [Candidatus Gottesmanbacteria bacterium]